MPNAKDASVLNRNILVVGAGGAGKTCQLLTLEGKTFAYLFDPHALDTIQGYDIEYEEFLPDVVDLGVYSLSKKANEAELASDAEARKKARDKKEALHASAIYQKWEKHFDDACDSGFFNEFDNIAFDSLTLFQDLVMDEVLRINGRPGQWPNQDDYAPAINAIRKIFRKVTSLNKQIYVCAHAELKEDELAKKVFYQLSVFGQLRTKLPLMFGHILPILSEAGSDGKVSRVCQTAPDRMWPLVRTTMRDVPFKADITIDWKKDPVGQGLGGLLKKFQARGNSPSRSVTGR